MASIIRQRLDANEAAPAALDAKVCEKFNV
jgi:hypothetical protein